MGSSERAGGSPFPALQKALRIDIDGDPHAAAPEPCHIARRKPWGTVGFARGTIVFSL
jgi:hypothetical protein